MRYAFITVLHSMQINSKLKSGVTVDLNTRVTNSSERLSKYLDSELFKTTAGIHSVDDFKDCVYFYKLGEVTEELPPSTMLTFYFLREAQYFVHKLWGVKDNGVYVRDGFLFFYEDDNIERGETYKASLSAIFSTSDGERRITEFSETDIKNAIVNFKSEEESKYQIDDPIYKYPTGDHFYKNNNPSRWDRAFYFSLMARSNLTLPMKITSYCTALECLFSTSNSEVVHKISERVAVFLGNSMEEKLELFKLIKKAYDIRSTVLHGSSIKGDDTHLRSISVKLDNILRVLLLTEDEIFLKNDSVVEEYFTSLLFK